MRKVTVSASRVYDILIEKGILDKAGEYCLSITAPCRAAILTDTNVAALYSERVEKSLTDVGFSTLRYTVNAGEQSKCAENYIGFLSFLAQNKITRSDIIVALGGGVVGDLAGFCAATYLRGIRFVQIPTTLLAMVDSSVGGKTGIDLPEGKNLVGAFYQPSLVLCDCQTIDTLPENVFADGCAEVIKYGIINDRQLFDKLNSPIRENIEQIIERCVCDKRDIVNADERDTGVRQLLNLGHTSAHSIEILSDFKISHGSAVSMGIAIACRAAAKRGYCSKAELDEVISMLTAYGLPTDCPFAAKQLAEIALSDKKRCGGKINLIIPFGIGNSKICETDVSSVEEFFSDGL